MHLGTVVSASPLFAREMRYRAHSANIATAALQSVWRARALPITTKVMIAKACVASRAAYAVASLDTPSRVGWSRLAAAYDRPFWCIWRASPCSGPRGAKFKCTTADMHRALGTSPFAVHVAKLRLSY